MIIRFFVVIILFFLPSLAVSCPYLGSTYIDADGSWSISNYCHSTVEDAVAHLDSLSSQFYRTDGPFVCPQAGLICGTAPAGTSFYIGYFSPVGSYRLAIFWITSEDFIDTDGDGTPDDQDPCPNNPDPDCTSPDTDGDGIPDDRDPCPANPDPNCKDPNDPPGPGDPPDIPDEIPVGDCVFDLRSFKEWLNTGSAFPFNLLFRFVGLVTPLFDLTPEAPVFEINWDLASYHDKYPYIPSTLNFRWDFTPYDTYAKLIRSALILSIIIFVISYGLNSSKERP